jgi:hypothetical protein
MTSPGLTRYESPEDRDRRVRMLPDPRAVLMAAAALQALPEARPDPCRDGHPGHSARCQSPSIHGGTRGELIAAIPMWFPGMRPDHWTVGQEVRTALGVIFIGVNSHRDERGTGFPGYGEARNRAAEAARAMLGDTPGVTAWATVTRDGEAAVFTDLAIP